MDWLQLVKELGLPTAFAFATLFVVARIYSKYLHPYLLSKDTANKEAQEKFLDALERISDKNAAAYSKIADAFNELKVELRAGRSKR